MGDEPIIIEQFFMGSRRLLWVRLWEAKFLWVWIMGITLVKSTICTSIVYDSSLIIFVRVIKRWKTLVSGFANHGQSYTCMIDPISMHIDQVYS